MRLTLALLVLALAARADTTPAEFYEVSTEGSSTVLKAGDKGRVVIALHLKPGAHMSEEAPLKIELVSPGTQLDKATLTVADKVLKPGAPPSDSRFEVGFAPVAHGPTTITAKMTFFVCTDKRCLRQTHNLSFPVEVQ
jgi:hypothetical protein